MKALPCYKAHIVIKRCDELDNIKMFLLHYELYIISVLIHYELYNIKMFLLHYELYNIMF
jgi:hypothetical protein